MRERDGEESCLQCGYVRVTDHDRAVLEAELARQEAWRGRYTDRRPKHAGVML